MKLLDKLIDRIADRAAEKLNARMKQERPSQIGFQRVEPENLHEAQWHHLPDEN